MDLSRHGARKFLGRTTIFQDERPELRWNEEKKVLEVTVRNIVEDSSSTYHYRLVLDRRDITSLMDCLSKQAITKSAISEWHDDFFTHNSIRSLSHSFLRLLLSSSGMVSQSSPLAEEPDEEES